MDPQPQRRRERRQRRAAKKQEPVAAATVPRVDALRAQVLADPGLLTEIFTCLRSFQVVCRAADVCRAWRAAAWTPSLSRLLLPRDFPRARGLALYQTDPPALLRILAREAEEPHVFRDREEAALLRRYGRKRLRVELWHEPLGLVAEARVRVDEGFPRRGWDSSLPLRYVHPMPLPAEEFISYDVHVSLEVGEEGRRVVPLWRLARDGDEDFDGRRGPLELEPAPAPAFRATEGEERWRAVLQWKVSPRPDGPSPVVDGPDDLDGDGLRLYRLSLDCVLPRSSLQPPLSQAEEEALMAATPRRIENVAVAFPVAPSLGPRYAFWLYSRYTLLKALALTLRLDAWARVPREVRLAGLEERFRDCEVVVELTHSLYGTVEAFAHCPLRPPATGGDGDGDGADGSSGGGLLPPLFTRAGVPLQWLDRAALEKFGTLEGHSYRVLLIDPVEARGVVLKRQVECRDGEGRLLAPFARCLWLCPSYLPGASSGDTHVRLEVYSVLKHPYVEEEEVADFFASPHAIESRETLLHCLELCLAGVFGAGEEAEDEDGLP